MTKSVTINGVEWFEGIYALREPFVHAHPDRRRSSGWRAPAGIPAGRQLKVLVSAEHESEYRPGTRVPAYVEVRTDAGVWHRVWDGVSPRQEGASEAELGYPSELLRLLSLLERVTSVELDVADALGLTDPGDDEGIAVRVLANLVRDCRVSVEHIRELTKRIEAEDEAREAQERAARQAERARFASRRGG